MKVLICGYIGGKNCGDEAICDRLIASVIARGDQPRLLSRSPMESVAIHGIPSFSCRSPVLVKALWECDLFILGGGTLLQTATSRRSAVYYLSLVALAAAMGKPWVLIGGVDPLSQVVKRLAKRILPTANAFFLRDRDSLRRAESIAPSVPRFYLPDCALLPLSSPQSTTLRSRFPYLLLCPKKGVREQAVAPLVRSAQKRGLRLVCLALSREDEAICAAFANRHGGVWVSVMSPYAPAYRRVRAEVILPDLPPCSAHRYFAAFPCEIACRLIEGAEEVHSARLHGLIFAKKAGVRGHILSDGTKQWKFRGFFNEPS